MLAVREVVHLWRLSSALYAHVPPPGLQRNRTSNRYKVSTDLETTATCWRSTRTSHRLNFLGLRGRDALFSLLLLPKLLPGHSHVVWHPSDRPWWRQGRHRESDLSLVPPLPLPLVRTSSARRWCIPLLKTLKRWYWFHLEWAPRAPDLPLWLPTPDCSAAPEGSPSRSCFSRARPVGVPWLSNCVGGGHMLGGIHTKCFCWAPSSCRSLGVPSVMEEAQAHDRRSPSPSRNTSSSFNSSPTNRRSGATKHHWMSLFVNYFWVVFSRT